ncbi:response regulator domain-containing protein [Rhizobium sp. N4311]|nr:response regulator domain-containing protein [Rhizobium sp. N4311]
MLKVADLELDLIRREARRAGQAIELQPREFTLLEVLMRGEG